MPDFLVSALVGTAFAAGGIVLVLGTYFAARRLLGVWQEGDRTDEVAGTLAVRIAALHGLILALVYAQELDDYKGLRSGLTDEAVAIADVYNDIRRYGGPSVPPIQARISQYVATVVDEEWDTLGRGEGLSAKAWTEWDDVYGRLLDLEPATDRQRYLANRMRDRITTVAALRQTRESMATGRFSGLFWTPALIGLLLLAVPLYVFRPSRTHIILFSLFGAYSGVILFFIYSFANPFMNPGRLEPIPFERLLKGDLGRSLPPAR